MGVLAHLRLAGLALPKLQGRGQKTKPFGEEGQLPLFKQEFKCRLTDCSWQGDGRKERRLPSKRVSGQECHRITARTHRGSAGIQETAREWPQRSTSSSASLELRQAVPSLETLPRDGCLLTPKISGYSKHKPLGQDPLWQLRDLGEMPKALSGLGEPPIPPTLHRREVFSASLALALARLV
ncbi:hypothetical protein E2320_011931 [Naja naja]|nr:hypothetical protein E2320_011931 [Naja naja]